ncbi:putative bacteriophage protein [Burkholderia pseudomallei]|uniref:hypothetical protein n=1 Tax=Burkholderia pseudomallei TaxID=28450 RepID=UPI000F08B81A|nr:hypothetical protein [Burkholderia pseudomallei]MBF3541917.1 hypothetical protein [Burkholderia pseudomallei]MBF3604088.1 hypothetical protein [Burkholderia pseudomallei]MBF3936057.1 hypothetical protein [Burkholderia pseudomallei]CAJ3419289.1 putative bacteriophage protein [Burkholderia pseudomallei]CAJ5998139.1 putative bacteriophage protein [Burkholderia pseudomallei]
MARPMYRIRQIAQPRVRGGTLFFAGAFQVQRRIAILFWREITYCSDRVGAEAAIRADVIARRRARIKPRVLGLFDRDGQEFGK